ncbi:MAG: CopG family transcriptional regulator [Nitrospirae bacterium]|nr:CopG family transcriptional regulator [Nitrospirota bacterium]
MRKTRIITISMMPELLAKAEAVASEEHRTISELFREALRSYMLNRQLQKLSRYGLMKAKELGIGDEDDVARLVEEYRSEQMNAQNSY